MTTHSRRSVGSTNARFSTVPCDRDGRAVSFTELYDGPNAVEPEGVRWSADGMWTNVKGSELVEPAKQLFRDVPTPESHIFWSIPWRRAGVRRRRHLGAGQALSGRVRGWHDPAEDDRYIAWPTDHMRRLESLSAGIQLADENLWQRPARYLSPENEARLERLRAQYDPDGRFHSYLTAAGGTE